MKTQIRLAVVVILAVLWAQVVLAAPYIGEQREARQQWTEAAESYAVEASLTADLNLKAELLGKVAKCYLKAGNITAASWTIGSIKKDSADGGATILPSIMNMFEEAGWKAASNGDFEKAFQALSVVFEQYPAKKKSFSEKAYSKGYKDLAYQLNSNLKEFDCKAKRTKALGAKTTADTTKQLAATRGLCESLPTEKEFQAFSAKALAETDDLIALTLYEQIKSFWGKIDQKGEDRMLAYGRKIRIIEGNETTVERIRQILPSTLVEDKLIRVAECENNECTVLSTKGGERTPYLISSSVVGRVTFFSNGCFYTIVLEDGQRFNAQSENDMRKFLYFCF